MRLTIMKIGRFGVSSSNSFLFLSNEVKKQSPEKEKKPSHPLIHLYMFTTVYKNKNSYSSGPRFACSLCALRGLLDHKEQKSQRLNDIRIASYTQKRVHAIFLFLIFNGRWDNVYYELCISWRKKIPLNTQSRIDWCNSNRRADHFEIEFNIFPAK